MLLTHQCGRKKGNNRSGILCKQTFIPVGVLVRPRRAKRWGRLRRPQRFVILILSKAEAAAWPPRPRGKQCGDGEIVHRGETQRARQRNVHPLQHDFKVQWYADSKRFHRFQHRFSPPSPHTALCIGSFQACQRLHCTCAIGTKATSMQSLVL